MTVFKKNMKYLALTLKRTARHFPFVLAVSLCLCLCLGLIVGTALKSDAEDENKQKLAVGIIGDTADPYLDLAISAIQSFDSTRFTVDMISMTEDEAKRALDNGSLAAYIVIPDGFVEGIMYNDIKKVTYISSEITPGMTTLLQEELTRVVATMVVEAQKGVYGMFNAARESGGHKLGELNQSMNMRYFSLILNRDLGYKTEMVGISDALSLGGYMICALLVIMLMLLSISFCPLWVKKELSREQLLASHGIFPTTQVLCELFCHLISLLFIVSGALAVLLLVGGDSLFLIPELENITLSDLPRLIFYISPAILLLGTFSFLLFELTSSIIGGILLEFISAIALGFASGCFYPISFLPETLQKLSHFLPSGIAREYLAEVVYYKPRLYDALLLFMITLVLLCITIILRHSKLKRA